MTSGLDSLKFSNDILGPMIEIGKKDAEKVLRLGEKGVFSMLNEWDRNSDLRKKYLYFEDFVADSLPAL